MRVLVLQFVAASALGVPALAGSAPPDDNGRYLLEPFEEGFFRTDRETGVSSFCKRSAGAWTCTLVPDDLEAFQDEIARLNKRIETLERTREEMRRRMEALESEGRGAGEDEDEAPPADIPKDRVDRTMDDVERMVRGFLGFVVELRRYFQ